MNETESFQTYHSLLFAIAYRMLGSATEAEDIIQDCYVRFHQADPKEIRSLKAYLTTSVTRLCLNYLASARVQRESYYGPWLPEPVLTANLEESVLSTLQQRESLSSAFLVLLECLTPHERAVFLLHEVFQYPYQEIATIIGKTTVHCRQLCAQAKTRIDHKRPRFVTSLEIQQRLVERFLAACQQGDMQALIDVLAQDVVAWSDGGGKVSSISHPLYGQDAIARLIIRLLQHTPHKRRMVLSTINGSIGILAWSNATLFSVLSFEVTETTITGIREVLNPEKLNYLRRQIQSPPA